MADDAVRLRPFGAGGPPVDVPRTVDDALSTAWPDHLVPGQGATRELWELLATLGATDLGVARAVEPHLDARAILAQAGVPDRDGRTWGVFAAEGPQVRLDAVEGGDGWRLTGTKPWCSLAGVLDAALVTAHLVGAGRALFAVDLREPGVRPAGPGVGVARAGRDPQHGADLRRRRRDARRPARLVPGASGVLVGRHRGGRLLVRRCGRDRPAGARRGGADATTRCSRCTSARSTAGSRTPAGRSPRRRRSSTRTSSTPRRAASWPSGSARRSRLPARTCSTHAAHALGPAPLALEPEHAKRVADLQVYVRQQHAERDDASLGRALAAAEDRRGDLRRPRTGHPCRHLVGRPAVPGPARAGAAPDRAHGGRRRAPRRRDPGRRAASSRSWRTPGARRRS